MEFFSKPSAIYTKWCAQTFPPIFGLFAIFDRNLAKIVAPPSDECENYEALSLPKKTLQTASKSAYKWQRNACSNYAPLERTVLRIQSVTNKQTNKQTNKKNTRNKSIVPARTMHTGRMSGHCTKKDVNCYVNNYHA